MNKRLFVKHNKLRLLIVLVLTLFLLIIFSSRKVVAEAANPSSYTINTREQLLLYTTEYNAGHRNRRDTLTFALSGGTYWNLSGTTFPGIGSNDLPFSGTIKIGDADNARFAVDVPLFKNISTEAKIINASTSNPQVREITILRKTGDLTPLFAETVTNYSGFSAEWKIATDEFAEGDNRFAYDFGGVIGTIEEDSVVEITFTHDAVGTTGTGNVVCSGNAGLICNTMEDGVELTVNIIDGDKDNLSITSNSGNAGGIVGEMGDEATLTLNTEYTQNAGGVNASNGNAGGIIGKVGEDCTLVFGDDFETAGNVISSKGGSAGGLVGYVTEDLEVDFSGNTVTISKIISSQSNAGGVFGYYKSTKDNDTNKRLFDLSPIVTTSDFILSPNQSNGSAGGIFGKLEATNNIEIDGSFAPTTSNSSDFPEREVRFQGGNNRGGIIGYYTNDDLDNSLIIKNNKLLVTENLSQKENTGFAIGSTSGASVYVKIEDFAGLADDCIISAGLIGDCGDNGSFIDLNGVIAIGGEVNNGLITKLNSGVLRIQGITDFNSNYLETKATLYNAQLVGTHGRSLVYAKGTGTSGSGWTLNRTSLERYDDIVDWGEVLRLDGTNLKEAGDLFNVDETHHTVTILSPLITMSNTKEFIRTALNIQLNEGNVGALLFADSTNTSANLLDGTSGTLSLTGNVNLTGTGILGLTRDNGTNDPFKGTFDGNSHTITLAVGEDYGNQNAITSFSSDSQVSGAIVRHQYNGLFAKTYGATIQEVKITGEMHFVFSKDSGAKDVGGLIAFSEENLTISDIEASQNVLVYSKESSQYVGGIVGNVTTDTEGTINWNNTILNTSFDIRRLASVTLNCGGAIGCLTCNVPSKSFTINFGSSGSNTFGGSFVSTSNNSNSFYFGGLIGAVVQDSKHKAGENNRKINIYNYVVSDNANIQYKLNGVGSGAFVGGTWLDVDVTIGTDGSSNGITLGTKDESTSPRINATSTSGYGNIGVLFYKGTGLWKVNHVKVEEASITSNNKNAFGFIIYQGYHDNGSNTSVIYLELVSEKYDISNTTIDSNNYAIYDEIVANTILNTKTIEQNGAGIISIRIPSKAAITMTGSSCNTYQNQIKYNGTVITKVNEKSRYYYNLDSIRAKASPSNGEKLLLWSLNQYAHSTVKSCFPNGFTTTISGNCDMKGLSYYPVDASNMTLNTNTVIKFYNYEIETGEGASGNTDLVVRSTHQSQGVSQHYLMHEGIFRNYTGNLNVKGLELRGNVSNDNGKSGFLVCGRIGGTESTSNITITQIKLSGAYISSRTANDYAPLLINTIGKNVKFTLSNVRVTTGSGSDKYPTGSTNAYASSLIGDVGNTTASNINLTFSNIMLDARATANTPDSGLTTAYGTGKSIFDRATLLNSFVYSSTSLAQYNFTNTEDWSSSHHYVTYGSEISTSVEYSGKQLTYYPETDVPTYYTHPTSGTETANPNYNFSIFLKYVYLSYDLSLMQHEIKVNVKDIDLTNGCGQYNDPYLISDGDMLTTIAKIINGSPDDGTVINLPNNLASVDMWCNSKTDHLDFTYSTSETKFINGSTKYDLNNVRSYLAGAFYEINSDITLDASFPGISNLGADDTSYTSAYAFRGVITGGGSTVITNNSTNPLIVTSQGCVVRELEVYVNPETTIGLTADSKVVFKYYNGLPFYGGLIGQVFGGDNIIDKVGIKYSNKAKNNANLFTVGGTYAYLVPIGGYVGVVLSGGVIFRNMSSVNTSTSSISGLTTNAAGLSVTSNKFLYRNPIIGRVISGYAFNEVSGSGAVYSYDEENSTLKNGLKNYSIPDLVSDSKNKLSVAATSATTHIINVPDGQAMFILSCIVNSGAGSANYNASTEQSYATISSSPYIAYRSNCSTRNATYVDIGTNESSSDDYNNYHTKDIYSGSNKVPYIISQYTTKDNSMYRARSICGDGSNVSEINLVSNANYYLPAAYQGIGCLFVSSDRLNLKFKSLNGNNATIIFNTVVELYDYQGTSSHENYRIITTYGIGLFNRLIQNDATNNTISDFTLSGSLVVNIRNNSNGNLITLFRSKDAVDTVLGNGDYNVPSVGALAGYTSNQFNIVNVNMSGLLVDGPKFVGGLIGFINGSDSKQSKIQISSSTNNNENTIKGGMKVGGLVGYSRNSSRLLIAGQDKVNDEIVTELKIDLIELKTMMNEANNGYKNGSDNNADYYADGYYSYVYTIGGLIGSVDNGISGTNEEPRIQIKNIRLIGNTNIEGGYNLLTHAVHWNNQDTAGGIVGVIKDTDYYISSVNVQHINAKSSNSAGAIGHIIASKDTGNKQLLEEVVVEGSESSKMKLYSLRMAGGLIGKITINNKNAIYSGEIESCSVKNADIQTNFIEKPEYNFGASWRNFSAVGTIIGGVFIKQNLQGTYTSQVNITNFYAYNCDLISYFNATSAFDQYYSNAGNGGLIGSISDEQNTDGSQTISSNRVFHILGHNILLDTLNIVHYNTTAVGTSTLEANPRFCGYICGNNRLSQNSNIKIVGISIKDTTSMTRLAGCMKAVDNDKDTSSNLIDHIGTGGYVIFADYNQVSQGLNPNTELSSLADANEEYEPVYPYITSNPSAYIGNSELLLTGEGITAYGGTKAITNILSNNGAMPYGMSSSYVSKFMPYSSKFSNYNLEQGTNFSNDFIVLIVDDISRVRTTEMIQSYIHLLTNTNYNYSLSSSIPSNTDIYNSSFKQNNKFYPTFQSFDYTANVTDVYSVNIYRMVYDEEEGKFVISNEPANLKIADGQFFMEMNDVDSSGNMFTLIDIEFYDPADPTMIAYHLYIPVLVRKLLIYDFKLAAGSGTNYDSSWYESRFGKALMENLGTPYTLYFEYEYEELQSSINGGDDFLRNYEKELIFDNYGSNDLTPDTVLVLVDKNRNGKPYYAYFSEAYVNGKILLSRFREKLSSFTLLNSKPDEWETKYESYYTIVDGKYVFVTGESAPTFASGTYYELTPNSNNTFTPVDLNDLLTLTATPNASGLYVVSSGNQSKTIKVDNTYYRLATDADSSLTHYDITLNSSKKEMYYISFFTSSVTGDNVYHYQVSSDITFGDAQYPSRINSIDDLESYGTIHLILGNIFKQTNVTLSTGEYDHAQMTSINNTIHATMQTKIEFQTPEIKSEVLGYLGSQSGIEVLQNFLLSLLRKDELTETKVITGDPRVDVEYTITTHHDSSEDVLYASGNTNSTLIDDDEAININSNYIEFANNIALNECLAYSDGAIISARFTLTYLSDEGLIEQFPSRAPDDENITIGVSVRGSSNIGYEQASIATSKSFVEAVDSRGMVYYRLEDKDHAVLYYNVNDDLLEGDYATLGINPFDLDEQSISIVYSTGVLDITRIFDSTLDYDFIVCKIKLTCKEDEYDVENDALVISDYLVDLWIPKADEEEGYIEYKPNGGTEYTFILPKDWTIKDVSTNLNIPINFIVKTGNELEEANHFYSNYRVTLSVELSKFELVSSEPGDWAVNYSSYYTLVNGEYVQVTGESAPTFTTDTYYHLVSLESSRCDDYIIYTNARIYPDFMD